MNVTRVVLRKNDLVGLSEEEQTIVVSAMLILNEINTLMTSALFSYPAENEPNDVVKKAQLNQALFFMALLAGKLNEAWKAVSSGILGSRAFAERECVLSAQTKAALTELRTYFEGGAKPIPMLRNKLAFHYDKEIIAEAYGRLKSTEPFETWLTQHTGGSRYGIGMTLTVLALERVFGAEGVGSGFKAFLDDLGEVTAQLDRFLSGILEVLLPVFARPHRESVDVSTLCTATIPAFPGCDGPWVKAIAEPSEPPNF
jgi:hypothetical protein